MKHLLFTFFVLFALVGCNKAKQLARLQSKHSYLFEKTMDRINYVDTIYRYVDSIRHDTSFIKSKDTVYIHAGDITTTVFVNDSVVYVDIFQPPRVDTLIINDTITVPRYIPNVLPQDEGFNFFGFSGLEIISFLTLLIVLFIIARARNWLTKS